MTLGQWPELSLRAARQKARPYRMEVGLPPPRGHTLWDAFALWKGLKKGRIVSYADEKRRLERYVLTVLGHKPCDQITAPMLVACMSPLAKAGKLVTVKRVLMRMREILDLAVCAGYCDRNPAERLSRLFPPAKTNPMPALDWRELPRICKVISTAPVKMQVLFLFQLCTMLRPGEAVKIRKDWIEGDRLTIPAEEMKKGREHRVPLAPFVLNLLAYAKAISPHARRACVFNGRTTHISSQSLTKWLHTTELQGKLVAHGLRSLARSWLADQGAPFEAAEACLAHIVGGTTSRAYQRSDYYDARKPLMHAWAEHISGCAKKAGLLPDFPWSDQENDEN